MKFPIQVRTQNSELRNFYLTKLIAIIIVQRFEFTVLCQETPTKDFQSAAVGATHVNSKDRHVNTHKYFMHKSSNQSRARLRKNLYNLTV